MEILHGTMEILHGTMEILLPISAVSYPQVIHNTIRKKECRKHRGGN